MASFIGGGVSQELMLVTVLSVSFNSETTIAHTIESVLNQTYGNIEYIIIDGASTDNTVEIVKSYMEVFKERHGRTLSIISEPDKDMYDALNKGIRLAHGSIVGNINTDDWYELDAVEKMAALFLRNPYDVAWGDLRIIQKSGDFIKNARVGKRLWTTSGWCHPSMFATREVLQKYPYACETMYDDFDFITRVHRAGRKILTLNEVIANFTFGGMSTQKSLKKAWNRVWIRYHIYRKNGMSRLYWFICIGIELMKYVLG